MRLVFLLCIFLAGQALAQAHAQGRPGLVFDIDALANVQTEAFDFMLPRTLEAVTAGQLAMWGLGGLTSIDPALSTIVRDPNLLLLVHGRLALEVTAQGQDASGSWARAAAAIVGAAYASSPAMRQAGQAAITKTLFDEMLAHIDPYSRYIPPLEAANDRDRRVGHAGIGVTLTQHGRIVAVRDVVIGGPAALAGMGPGDVIQWVDGHTALNRNEKAVESLLDGPEGTELRMGWISRDGSSKGATLTRVMTPPETVFPRREGDVEIVQITGFSQTTDDHVIQVIHDSLRGPRPVTGIILDLRGNRGGLLRSSVATANTFLPAGVVVRSSGRAPETTRIWMSGGGEIAKTERIVVLVDGGTASAAEILAAALADRGRAVVMGSSTFGKGVVQTIDPLPDGGELFLTWSRILAPRGWPIQSLGVMPQVCTSLGDEAVRRQLAALAAGSWQMEAAVKAHRAARAPLTPDQIVSIRERCPAADPREDDVTFAKALLDSPSSYAAALQEPMPEER
jgi:carboxyl-terminal processing protease